MFYSLFVQRKETGLEWGGAYYFHIFRLHLLTCVLEGKMIKYKKRPLNSAISLLWAINRFLGCSLDPGGLIRSMTGWRLLE